MSPVRCVTASGPWARQWGYSRAIRSGDLVEVSGTTAIDSQGNVISPGDLYAQTRAAIQIVDAALRDLGASLDDVIRTRVFLRDISRWQDAGRAHLEAFGNARPASSCIGGADFLHPDILVELEATAIARAEGW